MIKVLRVNALDLHITVNVDIQDKSYQCYHMKCTECNKESLIAHYLKYFIKSNGQVVLGGNDLEGPLCQQCWFDVGDRALGKPTLLQKEQDK